MGLRPVQRQYTGIVRRIENAQVAVYIGYATNAGHALIDALYLPRSWAEGAEQRGTSRGGVRD